MDIGAVLAMSGTYDLRKVDRTEVWEIIVSTAYTYDCGYETAIIKHYNVDVVERYRTREESIEGHKKWIDFIKDWHDYTDIIKDHPDEDEDEDEEDDYKE